MKQALVTGGATRVGRVIAERLAREGLNVAIHFHSSRSEAEEVVRTIRGTGRRAGAFRADLTNREARSELVDEVESTFGPIHLLVNNAAIFERTPIGTIDEADWDRHLDLNLKAPFFLSQTFGLHMKDRGGGCIVQIACTTGMDPFPAYLPYSASKAGLVSLTKGLAAALAPEVRVAAVAPGPVLLPEGTTEAEAKRIAETTLLKRTGHPEQVAQAVQFIYENDFVTGSVIPVDGGRLAR